METVVKIAGLWDLSWNTPIKEYDLWIYPIKEFDVDTLYMCPVTGIAKAVEERETIAEVLEENPDFTVIFCD